MGALATRVVDHALRQVGDHGGHHRGTVCRGVVLCLACRPEVLGQPLVVGCRFTAVHPQCGLPLAP
eukprot:9791998-Prorocentrum_lima.AAC.1